MTRPWLSFKTIPFFLESRRKFNKYVVLDWCLDECVSIIDLHALETQDQGKDHNDLHHKPWHYWWVRLKVVDTFDLEVSLDAESCLELTHGAVRILFDFEGPHQFKDVHLGGTFNLVPRLLSLKRFELSIHCFPESVRHQAIHCLFPCRVISVVGLGPNDKWVVILPCIVSWINIVVNLRSKIF